MLLTDEEIFEALRYRAGTTTFDRHGRNVAKAQLKKVVEWGEETCLDKSHTYKLDYKPKHSCPSCWQSLLEEVKG